MRALKQLLPQATFLTKEQATKVALKRVSGPSILHIATHGFFLENDSPLSKQPTAQPPTQTPTQTKDQTRLGKWVAQVENPLLRSGLALAGANQARSGNDNGVLTAFEATGLDLWGTKLVVLSACESGKGELHASDVDLAGHADGGGLTLGVQHVDAGVGDRESLEPITVEPFSLVGFDDQRLATSICRASRTS